MTTNADRLDGRYFRVSPLFWQELLSRKSRQFIYGDLFVSAIPSFDHRRVILIYPKDFKALEKINLTSIIEEARRNRGNKIYEVKDIVFPIPDVLHCDVVLGQTVRLPNGWEYQVLIATPFVSDEYVNDVISVFTCQECAYDEVSHLSKIGPEFSVAHYSYLCREARFLIAYNRNTCPMIVLSPGIVLFGHPDQLVRAELPTEASA